MSMIYFTEYKSQHITSNTIMCLDIEVSSFWVHDNIVYKWDKNLSDDFYNSAQKGALPYIWQYSIDDIVYYGREFDDLGLFIKTIEKDFVDDLVYLYVHNLAYEMQFLRQLHETLPITNMFAREKRKPMKFILDSKIECRCSYILTGLSLAKWGEELEINKKVGYLDYISIRTPKTPLNKYQLEYCEFDLRVMIAGLNKFREEYGTIKKIPLTLTGTVRNVIKQIYSKDNSYKRHITKMQPKTVEEMLIFKSSFCGGDTHANREHVAKVNLTLSYDETSAYPSFMVRKKFPCTPFIRCRNKHNLEFEKYCYIMGVRFKNIKAKTNISFLSKSRCSIIQKGIYDNGRIIQADELCLYCTEIDYQDILQFYDVSENDIEILDLYRSKKGYLDKKYVEFILELFKNKTTLKGVDDELYMNSKKKLNSLYGVSVTSIINAVIDYCDEFSWTIKKPTNEMIQETLDKIQEKWWNNVVAYVVGLYVTSWGRHELNNMIYKIGLETEGTENNDVVYYDTDSVKFRNGKKHQHLFEEQNKIVIEEMETAMKHYGIKGKPYIQTSPKGEKCILGTWDCEGYHMLKTLGAKKYVVKEKDFSFRITVSGVPKKASCCIKTFDDFEKDFTFPSDICQKGLSTYLENSEHCEYGWTGTMPDGYVCKQRYGINIRNIGYTLGITPEFAELVNYLSIKGKI